MAVSCRDIRLLQDFADALKGNRQRLEVLGLADGFQCREALLDIDEIIGSGTEDSADFVVAKAFPFAEDVFRAVENELKNLRFLRGGDAALGLERNQRFCGRTNRKRHREGEFLVENDLHDAERGAAQRVGIARAGGHYAYREAAYGGIEFVRESDGTTGEIAGDGIVEPNGAIVVVDGVGNFHGLALGPCVEATNDSLQLGEFAHHLGGEVALGELGGAVRLGDVSLQHAKVEPLLGQPAGDGADAFDFVAVAAEAGFIGDALEFRQIVGEPTLLVGGPEELRVGKARAEDTLVSGADDAFGIACDVNHREEVRGEVAVLFLDGGVFLVIAHDGDENFVRKIEEGGIEVPLDDGGKLVEIDDELSQRGILMDVESAALRMSRQFPVDLFLALRGADDDAVRMELLLIAAETLDADGARSEKAMAAGRVARRNAADGKLQRLAFEHGDDPSNGPDEARALEAGPGHGAGPGESVDGAREDGGEDLRGGVAEFNLLGGDVFALGSLDQVEVADVDTLLVGEAQRGTRRRADRLIGDGLGWAGDFGLDVGLLGEQATDPGREPAGSTEGFNRYALGQTLGGEKLFDVGAKFFLGLRKHACGNFFAANFEEEFDVFLVSHGLHARTSLRGVAAVSCSR